MTVPEVVTKIEDRAKAWRMEEIAALTRRDAPRAYTCRQKAAVLEEMARTVREAD